MERELGDAMTHRIARAEQHCEEADGALQRGVGMGAGGHAGIERRRPHRRVAPWREAVEAPGIGAGDQPGQEVGDIVLYLLLLCSELGLDMNEVVRAKLADSERRFAHE